MRDLVRSKEVGHSKHRLAECSVKQADWPWQDQDQCGVGMDRVAFEANSVLASGYGHGPHAEEE